MLKAAAARAPAGEALVFGDRRLDYAAYLACVAGFAHELLALGARNARVATLLPNSIEACVASFAILAAGAQHAPLNPIYTAREIGDILVDAAPAVIIVDASLAELARPIAQRLGAAFIVLGVGIRLLDPSTGTAMSLPEPLPRADMPALLQYTGGTTGRSKGVNLSHGAIATNVLQREALLPIAMDRERVLCVMPLFHSYAMAMGLFLAVHSRACLVILPRYRPDDLMAAIESERITFFPGGPTIFTGLMAHADFSRTNWSSVHTCYSGSAALSEETLRRWRDAVGAPVYEGYGQTEAGPILSQNPRDAAKAGSVGVALPNTEIQIVDIDSGERVLPRGERGEIRARGPQLMSGYRNLPDETAKSLRNGWLYTGDIGEFDADGYLYIRDRMKDMIIVGGYNVYPREIEDVLMLVPGVQEAAVVGRPDAYKGELVYAYVSLRPAHLVTPEELLDHCRKNLARYKLPAAVEILDSLPKTTINKLDKPLLRQRAALVTQAAKR